jgi:hypothetical protein
MTQQALESGQVEQVGMEQEGQSGEQSQSAGQGKVPVKKKAVQKKATTKLHEKVVAEEDDDEL